MAFKPQEHVIDLSFEDMPGIADGTTPEPSPKRVRQWRAMIDKARTEMQLDIAEDASMAEVAQALVRQDRETMDDLVIDAFATLCGADAPSRKRPASPGPGPAQPRKGATDAERGEYETALAEHDKARDKYHRDVAKWNEEWTGGVPTRQQLAELPYRYQAAWFEYLNEAFTNPTSGTAATNN